MSSVNYNLKSKGVRLIDSKDAFVFNKSSKQKNKFNPNYHFVGKINMSCPNVIFNFNDKKSTSYRGDFCELNTTCKKQFVNHFYDQKGNRNKKSKAYLVVLKKRK